MGIDDYTPYDDFGWNRSSELQRERERMERMWREKAEYQKPRYFTGDEYGFESLSTPGQASENKLKTSLQITIEELEETKKELTGSRRELIDLREKFELLRDQVSAKDNVIGRMKKITTALREKIANLNKFNRFDVMDLEEDE